MKRQRPKPMGHQFGLNWSGMEKGEKIVYPGSYGGAKSNANRASNRYRPMKFGVETVDGVTYVVRRK